MFGVSSNRCDRQIKGIRIWSRSGPGVQRSGLKKHYPFTGSKVQGFNSRPWTAFEMRICEKSVSFIRPNTKFGAKLAIIWKNEHLNEDFRYLMPSLSLTLNRSTLVFLFFVPSWLSFYEIYYIFNELYISCIRDDVKGNFFQKARPEKARNINNIGWVVHGSGLKTPNELVSKGLCLHLIINPSHSMGAGIPDLR